MNKFNNIVVIITGAAGGIGAAIARRLHQEGASLVLTDLNRSQGENLVNELGDDRVMFIVHDVTQRDQWELVIRESLRRFGSFDALVNNAGVCIFKGLEDYTLDDINTIMNVNLVSTMLGTQAVSKELGAKGSGSIVNMSSAEGLSSMNGLSVYTASKWAVRGYTKASAMELGHKGIRVNSVHPGGVNTPMANPLGLSKQEFDESYKDFPAQCGATPEQIASVVSFLISDDSSYCMGAEIAVDGGMTAGKYIARLPGTPE